MFEPMFCGKKKLEITVLGKPQPQQRVRVVSFAGKAHGVDPKASRDGKANIKALATQKVLENGWELCHKDMPVSIDIRCFKPIPSGVTLWKKIAAKLGLVVPLTRGGDADNIAKLCMDALTGVVYHDDAQVFDLHVTSRFSDTPRTEITVTGYFVNVGEIKDKVKLEQAKEKQK